MMNTSDPIAQIRARWERPGKPEMVTTAYVQADIDFLFGEIDRLMQENARLDRARQDAQAESTRQVLRNRTLERGLKWEWLAQAFAGELAELHLKQDYSCNCCLLPDGQHQAECPVPYLLQVHLEGGPRLTSREVPHLFT